MKFKYEKLNHKELNYCSNVFKKFLLGNSIVFTNPNRGRINKRYTGTTTQIDYLR